VHLCRIFVLLKPYIFFCLCWLLGAQVLAQAPVYLHFGVRDGLPSNLVYCAAQDDEGLLWFGSDKGLVCFDGTRFHTSTVKDGLPDQEVLNLKCDSEGRLWINCFRQKPCYRKNRKLYTEKQDTLLAKLNLQSGRVDVFEVPEDKSIWFSDLNKQFFLLRNNTLSRYEFKDPIVRIHVDGQQLFGLGERFIYLRTPEGAFSAVHELNPNPKAPFKGYLGINATHNRFLYSFNHGSMLLTWENGQIQETDFISEYIGRVYADKSGRFWICTAGKGAVCFDNQQHDLSNPVVYLPGKKISNMFEDNQGTLWFCTLDDGIYALPRRAAISYTRESGLPSNNIMSLAADPSGHIHFGDDEGNVHQIIPDGFKTTRFGAADGYNLVRQILFNADHSAWVATDEFLYYSKNNQIKKTGGPLNVKHIWADSSGLWVAAASQLGYVPRASFSIVPVLMQRFTGVCTDAQGYAWAGGIEGVFSQIDQFKYNWGDAFPMLRSRIKSILPAGPNLLWIATSGYGLVRAHVHSGRIVAVEALNASVEPDIEHIQSMYLDASQRLWLATNRGVFGIDSSLQFLHFDANNGLSDDDVNCVLVQHDTLWAGTVAGLSRMILPNAPVNAGFATFFTSLQYHENDHVHRLRFLDTLLLSKVVQLSSAASLIGLELSGLDYSGFGNLRYACIQRVELLDFPYWTWSNVLNWVGQRWSGVPDTLRLDQARLDFGVFLQSGQYRLEVFAITPSGVWSARGDQLTLVKLPAWYETLLFWMAFWGALAVVAIRLYRARNAYRDLDQAVSNLQLQAVQAQMNPHFIGNSINAIQQFFYPPDAALASSYIELLNRLLHQTMNFSENHFLAFRDELAYDTDYLSLIQLRFGERFRYEILNADMVEEHTPFPAMILQPILENATIHGLAPDGVSHVTLRFYKEKTRIYCIVQDNGVGYNQMQEHKKDSERRSRGLEMLLKKAQSMNKLYKIDLQILLEDLAEMDKQMHGTRVSISFDVANLSQHVLERTLHRRSTAAPNRFLP
jgi:ligand-binding sensor domain-containing protein/two-component sensor histidine kinase